MVGRKKRTWLTTVGLGAVLAVLVAGAVVAKGDPISATWYESDHGTSNSFWIVGDEVGGLNPVTYFDDATGPVICDGEPTAFAGFMRPLDEAGVWSGSLGNAWCLGAGEVGAQERRPSDGYPVPVPLPFSLVFFEETETVFSSIGACGGGEVEGVDSLGGVVAGLEGFPPAGYDCGVHDGMTVVTEFPVPCEMAWYESEELLEVEGTCEATNARVDESGNLFLMLWGQLPDVGAWEADGSPDRFETGCLANYLFLRESGFEGELLFGESVRYYEPDGRFLEVCRYEAPELDDLSGLEGPWHRNNNGSGHEVLTCTGEDDIVCEYADVPEPELGWPGSDVTGTFHGEVVDAEECPPYMVEACATAEVIARGTMEFSTGIVTGETIAVQADGSMSLSWDTPGYGLSPFVCPWYDSFDRALAEPFECDFFGGP